MSYLKFLLKSKTRHGVHSPFVYKLVEDVIYDKTPYPLYDEIEALRRKLLNDDTEISVSDFGSGPRFASPNKRKISSIAKTSVKSKKYGQLLFRLVQYFSPANILELGTSLGISTLYLAKPNPKARITTMEGCPEIASKARGIFSKTNSENIKQITGNFNKTLPEFLRETEKLDFVFFDGNHRKEPTLNYFHWCLEKAHNGSVFIFDDIHWSTEMLEAWEEIKQNPKVKVSIDLFFMGLVFFRKEQPKEHFWIRF